jgi:hypothetical protein
MDPPPYVPRGALTAQDFETASIRSVAPSYVSEAPTYVSTILSSSERSGLPSPYLNSPSQRQPRAGSAPSLNAYCMASWSRAQTPVPNPTTRHYHNIAHRRASERTVQEQAAVLIAALGGDYSIAQMKKRMDEEERQREMRTLEDPYLVGEKAAELNKQQRLKRENGWEVLEQEDKRWDWLLAQMTDWEERDKSWKKFRKELEGGKREKLVRRLGLGTSRS